MANMLEVVVALPRRYPTIPVRASHAPDNRAARHDARWDAICAALAELRRQRRRSVRIVDAECGCGTLLIAAVRHAGALGFTAIEGRGIDRAPAMIGRARAAAARLHDPSIGLSFEVGDMVDALVSEADFPADIVLWHGGRAGDGRPEVRPEVHRRFAAAGERVIADAPTAPAQARAA